MIAVTGASGFVGRAFCARLRGDGLAFRPLSRNASDGEGVALGAIGPQTDWRDALSGVTAVVHLAARVHLPRDAVADPLAAYRATNRDGTLRLAEQAARAGVRRLVFVSSIKVNGEETEPGRPFRPTDVPTASDPYGLSKWEAEQGLRTIAAGSGLEVAILRPPLVYGAGVRANFRTILDCVRRGIPLPLAGIRNKRSMIAVENLVDVLLRSLEHPRATEEVLLPTDGQDLSTGDLVRILAAALGRPARLFPVPAPLLRLGAGMVGQGAAARRLIGSLEVDSGPTRRLLDWAPPFTVAEALARATRAGW